MPKKIEYTIGETILQVRGVNQQYDGKTILRDVSFKIPNVHRPDVSQGQVFSILGKSGAGKTTLARIIAGLQAPTSGEVLVNHEAKPVKPGEVGFVFQNYILYEHLTVEGNLLLSAYQGMFREDAGGKFSLNVMSKRFLTWVFNKKILREKMNQYLDTFELRDHLNHYPSDLSGGQKQRLAILSQVLCSSRFIIFDEPFSGLDPKMKQKACEVILAVSRLDDFQTLGIITHDIDCAVWISDKLLIMGKESDPERNGFKPGNTVFKPYDLADHGLAWQDESIRRTPEFRELCDEIKYGWFENL